MNAKPERLLWIQRIGAALITYAACECAYIALLVGSKTWLAPIPALLAYLVALLVAVHRPASPYQETT